jgi:eukaryotic-like serine/threonine-protein kinase
MIRELGIGGMGAVYLVRELAPDRMVAMKFLRAAGSQSAFDRFLIEVRSLATLDHPHIIRVLSTDFFRSDPFFTTEYLSKGSLLKKLEEAGPCDPVEAAKLIATVARAVHAANENGVVHRDLKPSNILLTDDGAPKVADFGLAKRLDRDDELTTTFDALGSPPYMAPEQTGKLKSAAIDARTDVYGLGSTLYHLVTGRKPFGGDRPEDVMAQVVSDPPRPPSSIRHEVPRELEAIILKAMEKNPGRRYANAKAMTDDLERFLAGSVPEAPLLTWPRRVGKRLRRNRNRIAVAGLVVMSVLVVCAILWPETDPATRIRKELEAGRKVTLIGSTGKPQSYRWALGSPELGVSPTGDGTCSLEATGRAFLELCNDPMNDHYLLRAELRFILSKLSVELAPNARVDGLMTAGIYFGYSSIAGLDGATAHAMFVAGFDDTPFRRPMPPKENQKKSVHLRRFVLLQDPFGGKPMSAKSTISHYEFDPANELPGPWRLIEIEVSPARVRTMWQEPNGTMIEFASVSADTIRKEYARLGEKINEDSPNREVTIPVWSPRMAIGIWSDRAAIDIRNVSISPLR